MSKKRSRVGSGLEAIAGSISSCRRCPRLVEHRERVSRVKVRRHREASYWGRGVPSFGDPEAALLIVGLAPAAHGANRTGRMFTGDRSGDWLYEALHRFGFASQPDSVGLEDGLVLTNAYISAVVHCAPPVNKPTRDELDECRPYLVQEIETMPRLRVVLALGRLAFDGFYKAWLQAGYPLRKPKPQFGHGSRTRLDGDVTLYGSYHPSQQNTFTGRLTRRMFHGVFRRIEKELNQQ